MGVHTKTKPNQINTSYLTSETRSERREKEAILYYPKNHKDRRTFRTLSSGANVYNIRV